MNTEKKNKNTNFLKKMIIIFSTLLAIILCVIMIIHFNTPKYKFSSFTNDVANNIIKMFRKKHDSNYVKIDITPEVSGTYNNELENIINRLNFKITGGIDYKTNKMSYNLKALYSKEELLNTNLVYNKNLYLYDYEIYKNPIKIDSSNVSSIFEKADNKNLKTIIKGYTRAFNKSLKNSYFTKSKKTEKIDGSKQKYEIITLNLDKANSKEFVKNVNQELLSNKSFLRAYSNESKMSLDEVKKMFNNKKTDYNNMKIILHKKGSIKKVELLSDDSSFEIVIGDNNNYTVMIKSNELSVKFYVNYTINYNKKIKVTSYENSVDEQTAKNDIMQIFTNFVNQKGFSNLNSDLQNDVGIGLNDIISQFLK